MSKNVARLIAAGVIIVCGFCVFGGLIVWSPSTPESLTPIPSVIYQTVWLTPWQSTMIAASIALTFIAYFVIWGIWFWAELRRAARRRKES